MCYPDGGYMTLTESIFNYGVRIFLLIWVVFVPIAITARLEKIIKLLEAQKK